MSLFDKFKKGVLAGRDELANQVARFKNKKFLDCTIAICVGTSMANGSVGSEEKQKTLGFIQSSPELKVFDVSDVIKIFNELVANYAFDPEVGKGEVMKRILLLKDSPEALQLAIRVGIAVGKSDGEFEAAEQEFLRSVCSAVNIKPTDVGLQ